MNPAAWAGFASAMVLAGACAAGASGPPGDPNGEPLGQGGSSSGSAGGSSSGTGPCTTCGSPSDDSGEPTGNPPSGGSSSGADPGGDDAIAPSGDEAGTPITLPPFSFPDAGLGGSAPMSTGDGGTNVCSTKICIDPVFDCPLQGCFNGCTNFVCN